MSEEQRRFKPAQSLKQRLVERVRGYTEAILLPPVAQCEGLLGKARQTDPPGSSPGAPTKPMR